MERVRLGLIGAGFIATRHLKVLQSQQDAEITAISDPSLDSASALAAPLGVRTYADWRAMLDREHLDAVFICTPPFAHGAPEQALVERRIPFFVEKPLAPDTDTAEAISTAVSRAGLTTAVGYHWRWLDTVDEAARLLEMRPARLLSGYWLDFTPPPAWWRRQHQSGGQFVEQTTHIFDLARYLVGEVETIYATGARVPRDCHPDCDVGPRPRFTTACGRCVPRVRRSTWPSTRAAPASCAWARNSTTTA
jgi:predicted dehydrogenase